MMLVLEHFKTDKNVEFLNSFTQKSTSLHTKSFDMLFIPGYKISDNAGSCTHTQKIPLNYTDGGIPS